MEPRFEGRAVLVTGGSSGIGRATAHAFVSEGAHVMVTGRDEGRLEETREAASDPGRVVAVAADLATPGEAARVVAAAVSTFGRLHVLVNNAGFADETPILETTDEVWRATMAVNLDAVFSAAREAGRHMAAHGDGAIVNVSSIDAIAPEAPMAAYSVSKAAVSALTRALALELGPRGVRTNAVAPGETDSAMTRVDLADERLVAGYLPRIPLRRFGLAEEQAAAIRFLASDEASFVNGAILVVDGGQTSGSWYYPEGTGGTPATT
jgi:meso-butanediol dehydrogenase/(S,S)-butanediol dehydrogenase/diacetyl reductase